MLFSYELQLFYCHIHLLLWYWNSSGLYISLYTVDFNEWGAEQTSMMDNTGKTIACLEWDLFQGGFLISL